MRVAIAGAGFGADVHAPAIAAAGGVVAAVCDNGSGKADSVARHWGCPVFHSWRDMLTEGDMDVVAVATPPASQRMIVEAALDQGLHVLCEKPFGLDVAEGQAMQARVRAGKVVAVGFQFRFEPALQAMRRIVIDGAVGRVWSVDVSWLTSGRADPARADGFQHDSALGGGTVNTFATHVFDYLGWLLDSRATSVAGTTSILIPRRGEDGDIVVTAEDALDATVNFKGISAHLRICNCQPSGHGHRIEIFGTKGWIACSMHPPFGPDDVTLSLSGRPCAIPTSSEAVPADSRIPAVTGLWESLFAKMAGAREPDLPLFADGLAARRLADALLGASHP